MNIENSNYVLSQLDEGVFFPNLFGKKMTRWERFKDYVKKNKGRIGARVAGHMIGSIAGAHASRKYGKDVSTGALGGAALGQSLGELLYNKYKGQAYNSMDNREYSDWHRK